MTRLKILTVGLIASFFLPLFAAENTFAEWVQQSSTYVDSRSYTLDLNNGNLITDQSFGTRSIPFNILSHIEGENRGLQEFVLYQSITDNSSDKFKSVIMDITVKQARTNSQQNTINFMYPEEMGFTITTNKGNAYGSCVTNEMGFDYVQYRCSGNAPEQATVTGVYMRIGDKSIWEKGQPDSYYIGIIDSSNVDVQYNTNNIQVTYVSVNLTTTADPLVNLTQTIINQNNQIIGGINQINNNINNQYQQEKQEENEREQQGNADANQLSGLFNFNVINPLNLLYTAVTPNQQCANIPTIANMLHVENTQYCNWFPNSVRSILTPVISLSSMMLVFGYLMAWLRRSSVPTIDIVTPDGRK